MLDQAGVWTKLQDHYHDQWLRSDVEEWAQIKQRIELVNDLRLTLRKMANSEVDNAG